MNNVRRLVIQIYFADSLIRTFQTRSATPLPLATGLNTLSMCVLVHVRSSQGRKIITHVE